MRKRILVGVIVVVLVVGLAAFLAIGANRGAGTENGLHIAGMLHVNVNVSDFDRSRAFYERLGFTVLMKVEEQATKAVASAVAMDSYRVRGALMAHKDGSVIDLLEWRAPQDARPPYSKLNHLGIARIALTTTDIEADVARLKAEGVEFLSDAPAEVRDPIGGTTRFICFKDPDGTVLELVEMGTVMGLVQRASEVVTKSAY